MQKCQKILTAGAEGEARGAYKKKKKKKKKRKMIPSPLVPPPRNRPEVADVIIDIKPSLLFIRLWPIFQC